MAFPGLGQTAKKMISHPIIPGYFADPSVVKVDDTFYIYATIGRWKEGVNSPILSASADSTTYGSGHQIGQSYLLYHRIFPQKEDYVLRQLCIDSSKDNIKKVTPRG